MLRDEHGTFFKVLGVKVQAFTIADLNHLVIRAVSESRKVVIANHNLHSVYLYHHDAKMRRFYEELAHYVHIDGMPLVWWGKFLGYPLKRQHRVGYMDWLPSLLSLADANRWRIYHLGGKPGVAERGYALLLKKHPHLQVRLHHGYFDMESKENTLIIQDINAFSPHILFVGMGMPRQEHWIFDNFSSLSANVILPGGGYIDYIAGEQTYVPRWIGYLGLEWAFRLVTNPKRLWRRYLVEPWSLVGIALQEVKQRVGLLQ